MFNPNCAVMWKILSPIDVNHFVWLSNSQVYYNLRAFVEYEATKKPSSSHYIAYVNYDKKWYRYSDNDVRETSIRDQRTGFVKQFNVNLIMYSKMTEIGTIQEGNCFGHISFSVKLFQG